MNCQYRFDAKAQRDQEKKDEIRKKMFMGTSFKLLSTAIVRKDVIKQAIPRLKKEFLSLFIYLVNI